MTKEEFQVYRKKYAKQIDEIRAAAHELHDSVNQIYGDGLPYGFHLDMVVDAIRDFGYLVCACEEDVLPLFFGGYYHDSIEDARLTYNDVMRVAKNIMTEADTDKVYSLWTDYKNVIDRSAIVDLDTIREKGYTLSVNTYIEKSPAPPIDPAKVRREFMEALKEVQEYLGVGRESVLSWIAKKNMPAYKVGRLWKFKLSEVDEWVRSGGAAEEKAEVKAE